MKQLWIRKGRKIFLTLRVSVICSLVSKALYVDPLMKKSQARANILAQDPMAPQNQQTSLNSGRNGPEMPPNGYNDQAGAYPRPGGRQRQSPQRYHQQGPPHGYQQRSGPPQHQPYGAEYAEYDNHYPPQQQYNGRGYYDQYSKSQQQPHPSQQQQIPPQVPSQRPSQRPQQPPREQYRHVSHDGYGQRDQYYDDGYYQQQPQQQHAQQPPRQYQQQQQQGHPAAQQRSVSYQQPSTYYEEPLGSVAPPAAVAKEDQSKIKELEEKIQQLEKMMALKNDISASTSQTSLLEQTAHLNIGNGAPNSVPQRLQQAQQSQQQQQQPQSQQQPPIHHTSSSEGAPALPPPPPSKQRSLSSSPKAALFSAGFESVNSSATNKATNSQLQTLKDDDPMRLSTSSLIPTDKSEHSLEQEDDVLDELPPPSYDELEKSGSLTYSKSIYRTGFEKAGYQLDHVAPSPTTTVENPMNERLMSKRRVPPQIKDSEPVMQQEPEPELKKNSVPASTTLNNPPSQSQRLPLENRFTNDSLYTSSQIPRQEQERAKEEQKLPPSSKGNFIKYQTVGSFKSLDHGIIEPILPSKSLESDDIIIQRFRSTRDQALKDYNQFTPKIQFYWAILLLETMSNQKVLSMMAIDGKIRKIPLSFKKLEKQRSMFLTTAIKVLEKLIQIAPDDTRAKLYLGDIYSGGIHPGILPRDEKRGFQYFMDAAIKQDDPVGCYRVACCLESGVGCSQDVIQSTEFFKRGAQLGDPSSMCQLGMMHFAGVNGCEQNIDKSIQYHKDAYETLRSKTIMSFDPLISMRSYQDARGAFYTLAKIYQTDRNILFLNDGSSKSMRMIEQMKRGRIWCHTSRALKYYLEAAKLGHSEAQACLGYYYTQGFFPTMNFKSDKEAHNGQPDQLDAKKSIYWFSKAAADGHVYASLGLARWYGSGADGILPKDEQQAFLWGRKAADVGGLPEAEFMIGMCFETGFGTQKNKTMAINYYERSASKGYKKAKDKLRTIV